MTTSKEFFKHWDDVQDVTLRLLKQIPADKLDYKPTPENMTLAQVAVHPFFVEKVFIESADRGGMTMDDFKNTPNPEPKSVREIYDYAKQVHDKTNELFGNKSWDELTKKISTPWGEMSIFDHLHSAFEHLWHHRGQLYVYLRMTGVKNPVFLYDYPGMKIHS